MSDCHLTCLAPLTSFYEYKDGIYLKHISDSAHSILMSLTIDLSLRRNRTPPWSDDWPLFGPVCSGRASPLALAERVLQELANLIGGGKGLESNA